MISLRNVSVVKSGRPILEEISLSLGQGEFVFLVGPTGAGKTSLLRVIHFAEPVSTGEVTVGSYSSSTIRQRDIPILRRKIGVVFQDGKLLFDRTVFENVALPLHVSSLRRSEVSRRVYSLLGQVGLVGRAKESPGRLSGGEQRRVAVARAMVNSPFLILSDEPTANLDAHSALDILSLLESASQAGTTVLMATHDEEMARRTGYRIVRIESGRLSG